MDDEQADPGGRGNATASRDYADRLVRLRSARWKQVIDVQAPYRWNIRRLRLGRTLDVGCGIGRNLHHLGADAVGVDHNAHSVAVARSRGLTAYTGDELRDSADAVPGSYDTLLLAHVVEHMNRDAAIGLLTDYLAFLRPGGRVVLITPQEAGYHSDPTHVRFVDFAGAADLAAAIGFDVERRYSFPFPRMVGKVFPYNEFVTVTRPPRDKGLLGAIIGG
jgi:2-polyprenyl-3-methyl-5-hydroxy-6-metoxy-1,4-benzoquinol methylase